MRVCFHEGALSIRYTENMDEEPEIRPLPPAPRCRGIPLGDGNYMGCAYGYGDLTPLSGPCDCPVCHGSGFEGVVALIDESGERKPMARERRKEPRTKMT